MYRILCSVVMLGLTSCTQAPPVSSSQDALWQKFGHQSIDTILLAWGSPAAETRLTDGSRMVTYRHTTLLDAYSPYARSTGCEVTFLAKSPAYRVENIAMKGDAAECQLLAGGRTGMTHMDYPEPP